MWICYLDKFNNGGNSRFLTHVSAIAQDKPGYKNLTKIITIDGLIRGKQIHRVDKWRNKY